ncbi:hypothetical protein ABK040_011613 [Willaertia magna]
MNKRAKRFEKRNNESNDGNKKEEHVDLVSSGYHDKDGHIQAMMQTLKRRKTTNRIKKSKASEKKNKKEKEKKEIKEKKRQKEKEIAEEKKLKKQKKKRKKIDENSDLFNNDEILETENRTEKYTEKNYDSDESDIIDDLDENTLQKSGSESVFINKQMYEQIQKGEEDPDDRLIAYLERKLGIDKKKNNKNNMDDLDDDPLQQNDLEQYVKEKRMQKKLNKKNKKGNNEDDEDDGLETVPGYIEPEITEEDTAGFEGLSELEDLLGVDGEDLINLDAEIDAMLDAEKKGVSYTDFLNSELPSLSSMVKKNGKTTNENDNNNNEEEESDIEDDMNDDNEQQLEDNKDEEENDDNNNETNDEVNEDNEEDEKQNVTETATEGKYLPPHLRKRMQLLESGKKSENYLLLQKSLRNLLNKISLANIVSITKESLELYQNNSKNDFHEILPNCILGSVCETDNLKSDFILVYAAYVTALHNIGGSEIGSYFVEKLIQKFESCKTDRFKATNLLTLICHVYNLGLIYCGLIYDIIRMCCTNFNELNVELMFKLLQACGFQLKLDDSNALKDIIDVIKTTFDNYEETTKDKNSTAVGKRMKFLVEMICDLRSNRKRQYQEEISEQYKQLRQTVKDLQKQEKKIGENTLRIPYNDLLNAETNGRWWLVGTAWVGNQFGSSSNSEESSSSFAPLRNKDYISNVLKDMNVELLQKLEKLAKEQRLTTDLRKAIFYVLMGSDDLSDAFQRLVKLGIQKNNREIARVLIHCCCQEKTYNPYYARLAEKLCGIDSTFRSFQYTFYEQFDELNNFTVRKIINLSKLLSELIGKGCLSLSMLKIVDFNNLVQMQLVFYRLLFIHLLLDYTEVEMTRIFLRLAKLEEQIELKESLVLFLYQFIKKEFRSSFMRELLALRDVSKKDDKNWLKEQEKLVKKRATMMRKVLKTDISEL